MRGLTPAVLASLCSLVGLLALSAVPARAAITHKYLSRITEIPAEGPHKEAVPSHGLLSDVEGMTVEEGHLWAAERGGEGTGGANRLAVERVDEFDAANGGFEAQLPQPAELNFFSTRVAVRRATPELPETELYLVGDIEFPGGSTSVVGAFGPSGNLQKIWTGEDTPDGGFTCPISGLGEPCADNEPADVAVDNSTNVADSDWAAGDVYVALDSSQEAKYNVVDVFKPEAGGGEEYVGQLPGPEPGGYFSEGDRRLAVDEANGDVLVAEGESTRERVVYVFEPSVIPGEYTLVRKLTGPEGHPFSGNGDLQVAVDGGAGAGSGDVYVADQSGNVYEFGPEGAYLGKLVGTSTGGFGEVESLAVDAGSGDVYVGALNNVTGRGTIDVFGPNAVVPDVTTGPPSDVSPMGARLNGTVDPDGAGPATCAFVWGASELFGEQPQSCEAGVPEGNAPVAVHASLAGKLRPDTTYYYRLQATNTADGLTNVGEALQDQHFTTPGPGIEDESASNVASTSATLDATIDAHGAPTSYYFQYGTGAEYGSVAPAPPGAQLGSGEEALEVDQHVQGLAAGSVYHYRVAAVSEVTYEVEPGKLETKVETFYGADQTFTTQVAGAFALPDGRQWEMVSSPDKLGADILSLNNGYGGQTQASVNGNVIAYETNTPTESGAPGYPGIVTVLSTRGPGGWSSRDLADQHGVETGLALARGAEYRLFSPDLSEAVVQPFGVFEPSLSPEASEQTAFLHTDFLNGDVANPCVSGCFRPLVTGAQGFANVPPGSVFGQINQEPFGYEDKPCPPAPYCGPRLEGATPDLSHIVLKTGSGSPEFPYGLYEWTAGKLAFVSESKTSFLGGSFDGLISRGAISDDGSRVIFTADSGALDMRDVATGTTVQLAANTGSPTFQAASSYGSRVFFSDHAALTGDAGGGTNLYECEMVEEASGLTCKLTDLTPLSSSGVPGEALGVLAASEDGSYVYFVADGVLENKGVPVHGAVPGNCNSFGLPGAGESCDLYVRHDGVTKLIALLSGEDARDWGEAGSVNEPSIGSLSSDGRWLAFMSSGNLTGYDTRDAVTGAPDQEVYLYNSETGSLVCASCNPSGARPVGAPGGAESPLGGAEFNARLAADIPGLEAFNGSYIEKRAYQTRYLSDSGRLFFNSHDALVPQDVNGTWDVYEYEPPGVGGCTGASAGFSARSDGCVGLISSGSSPQESAFLDASEGGSDVFFLTTARLASQDYDQSYDVYDAHECTASSPCPPVGAVAPPPCTSGDSCKPAPTPQPASFGAPASATFSGAGNVSQPPPSKQIAKPKKLAKCRRGFVKSKGKCVRKTRRGKRSRAAGSRRRGRR